MCRSRVWIPLENEIGTYLRTEGKSDKGGVINNQFTFRANSKIKQGGVRRR